MTNPEKGEGSEDLAPRRRPWQRNFEEKENIFPDIQENMPMVVELLKERGAKNVLDLGCGQGRHSVYLARNGMRVSGIDGAPEGIKQTQAKMEVDGLAGDFREGDIYEPLPYPDGSFDALISTQTIDHAEIEEIQRLIKEMERVLTPDGIIFITVANNKKEQLSKKGYRFKEIAPFTIVPEGGFEDGLTHYSFNEERLKKVFGNFQTRTWEEKDGRHICLLGERKQQVEQ